MRKASKGSKQRGKGWQAMLELVKQASQRQALTQRGQRTGLRKCKSSQDWAVGSRIKDQSQESRCEAWCWCRLQIPRSCFVDSCLMSPVVKQMHWIWSLFSVTSVTADQQPEEPHSSWAVSSLYAFGFDSGFSVSGSPVFLVPVVLYCLLNLQFFIREQWNCLPNHPRWLNCKELEAYSSLAY